MLVLSGTLGSRGRWEAPGSEASQFRSLSLLLSHRPEAVVDQVGEADEAKNADYKSRCRCKPI